MAATDLNDGEFVHLMDINATDKHLRKLEAEELHIAAADDGASDNVGETRETLPSSDSRHTPTGAPSVGRASDLQTEETTSYHGRALLDMVLTSLKAQPMSKWRRRFLKEGDVIVVLDRNDLSITCRMRSNDLRRSTGASFLLEPDVDVMDGVKYLCVLEMLDGQDMPRLAGRKLSAKMNDSGLLYARASNDSIGVEVQSAACRSKIVDWVRAYESFFRIITHVDPKHQLINTKDIHAAVPHIEAISRIAAAERANTPRSALTTALKVLFAESPSLWAAIAKEPARWLKIGQNLQHESVFKEATVHLIGQYPSFSSDQSNTTPEGAILATIRRLAVQKHYHKLTIDREILLITIDMRSDILYLLLHYVLDWISEHLRGHSTLPSDKIEPGTFCHHDNAQCMQPASFYRLLHRGGDLYLPEVEVFDALGRFLGNKPSPDQRDSIRDNLKLLKAKISSIVEPTTNSALQYEKKAELPYLTNVSLEAGDIPWLAGFVSAAVDDDDDDDAGDDSDMED